MLDIKRNKQLARIIGWVEVTAATDPLFDVDRAHWNVPGGNNCYELPDFCGDDCAAVKWLLPFLREKSENTFGAGMDIHFFREQVTVTFQGVYKQENSLSRALAAAGEGLKGGDAR